MRKVEELGLSECVLRHPSFSFFALCVFFAVYCLPVQAKLDSIVASGVSILKSKAYIGSSPAIRIGRSGLANAPVPSAIAKPETIQRGDTRICRVRRPRGAN
jgi:hypothetical protein